MTPQVFDIALGKSSVDTKVSLNGEDITAALRGVEFSCIAGALPVVKLILAHNSQRVRVEGAIAECQIVEKETA